MLFPVVYFTNDGTYDHAWYKTTLEGAKKTAGMMICLFPKTLQRLEILSERRARILRKELTRKENECKSQELAMAEYIYIDGNNFIWDNDSNRSSRMGLALVDRLLKELNQVSARTRFPRAKIRLFFDGGITHAYRPEFLERLNDGSVTICPRSADPVMLAESKRNGCEERTFIISNDKFDEYVDYDVIKRNRVIRAEFHNSMLRIPDMNIAFKFDSTHFAHKPTDCPGLHKDVMIRAYSNGKLVCADDWGHSESRPLVANRDHLGVWERFVICRNSDGTISLKSKANGKYVTTMVNEGGQLLAQAEKIDMYERFWITKRIWNGHYVLRSHANMKYVSVNLGTGLICATADVADEWEWLTIELGE